MDAHVMYILPSFYRYWAKAIIIFLTVRSLLDIMQVKQFRYSADNLGYLIYGRVSAIAIDGGAVNDILSFINTQSLELKIVTNTHTHFDHTSGNKALLNKTQATFIDTHKLYDIGSLEIEEGKLKIYHTPGHTNDSFSFHIGNFLMTGDTLFNGKAGRCFSGDLKGFLNSIKTLMALPEETIIYAGHDYIEEYMDVAKKIEPDNRYIDTFLDKYNKNHIFSTLGEELKINPCLRFNDKKMISILKNKNLPVENEYDRWKSIMSIV